MKNLWNLYHADMPAFISEMAQTPLLQRLKKIGMNCGCEYTGYHRFVSCEPYSRYQHSIGVALIVWHFTGSRKQASAGLLHDVATPAFAHVIDFLRGDHMRQESTEDGTAAMIAGCKELQVLLRANGLNTEQVCDYHLYPIADNDSPKLSADRLEYTLGNMLNYGIADEAAVTELYRDLTASVNEYGEPELVFRTPSAAYQFARFALACSEIYVSDEDRFAMQTLANLVRDAIAKKVLSKEDLYKTEDAVIAELCGDEAFAERWQRYCGYHMIRRSDGRPEGAGWLKVSAKRRYIDPLIKDRGRVSEVFPDMQKEQQLFLSRSFDYWINGGE